VQTYKLLLSFSCSFSILFKTNYELNTVALAQIGTASFFIFPWFPKPREFKKDIVDSWK
jgi:hypothetical protein